MYGLTNAQSYQCSLTNAQSYQCTILPMHGPTNAVLPMHSLTNAFQCNAVPLLFAQSKFPVQLQIQCVIGSHLQMSMIPTLHDTASAPW